jgi:hypothetical protein
MAKPEATVDELVVIERGELRLPEMQRGPRRSGAPLVAVPAPHAGVLRTQEGLPDRRRKEQQLRHWVLVPNAKRAIPLGAGRRRGGPPRMAPPPRFEFFACGSPRCLCTACRPCRGGGRRGRRRGTGAILAREPRSGPVAASPLGCSRGQTAISGWPYFFTARSIPGPAFLRSSRFITGWISTLALKARNQGSARAGI